ncbi:MAG: hypothetical protein COB85_04065 [Bacteroidetes bacterium]|nr:MAG: hypothetical protein COB85_04065 [Bacteroidota bacterium]
MRNCGLLICIAIQLWFGSMSALAQQPSHYSQFVFNNFVINPAAGGLGDYMELTLGYRTQWLGFDAAPKTYLVSFSTPIKTTKREPRPFGERNHHAIGAVAIKDETGPISKTTAHLNYSYHVRLDYSLYASLGIFAGIKQFQLNTSNLKTAEPDGDLQSFSATTPDAAVGVWIYSKKYFAGLSAHQLIPVPLAGTANTLQMHYFLSAGYKIPLKKLESNIIPSGHVKFGILTPIQVDINVKFDYKNMWWVGISYRKIDAVVGIVGFNLDNYVQVGYAFDFTTSKLMKYSNNTHEIFIRARLKPKKGIRDMKCPEWG